MSKKFSVDDRSTNETILWVRPSTKKILKRKIIMSRIIKDWLYQKYAIERLYGYEIAEIIGVAKQTIFNWLKEFNIPIKRPFLERSSGWQGGINHRNKSIYLKQPYHPQADKQGYIPVHQLIAERILGRFLNRKKEVVHHINFNRQDNRNSNLLICSPSYHKWLHWQFKKLELVDYFKILNGKNDGILDIVVQEKNLRG